MRLISLVDGVQSLIADGWLAPFGWSSDGSSVYARDPSGVTRRFPLAGGEGEVVPHPDIGDASCLPYERAEGVVWICTNSEAFSDAWMIENFDPEYAIKR